MSVVQKIFGTHSEREIRRISGQVDKIEELRPTMMEMSDEQLRDKTKEFKKRLTQGETLDDLLPEAGRAAEKTFAEKFYKLRKKN